MSYADRRQQQMTAEYRWRLEDSERQVDLGFPLARMANTLLSMAFIETMERYDRDEKLRGLKAVNKWAMPKAAAALGEPSTAAEVLVARQIQWQVNHIREPKWLEVQQRAATVPQKIKRPRLASMLTKALVPVLGGQVRRDSGDARFFTTPIGDSCLGTHLLFGSRVPYSVSVVLQVRLWADEFLPLAEFSSILDPYTGSWDVVTEDDVDAVVVALSGLLAHSLEIVPSIVREIADRSPYPSSKNDVSASAYIRQ